MRRGVRGEILVERSIWSMLQSLECLVISYLDFIQNAVRY